MSRAISPSPKRPRRRLPRKLQPKSIERDYYKRLAPIVEQTRDAALRLVERLAPALALAGLHARQDAARADASAFNEEMERLARELAGRLNQSQIEALAGDFARRTSSFEKTESAKQVRAAFGVDVLTAEPNLAARSSAFVSENVALIKSIPSQMLADIEKRVTRAIAQGATPAQLAEEIKQASGVADRRAMLIARDQVGKYFGLVAKDRQRAMGVTRYVWRTANDERVRPEHAAREGEVFEWSDPPEGGHPGQDYQCRCVSEPVLDDLIEAREPEPEREEKPDLEAAREAHQAELERRLAEQEEARAERQRALEERARAAEAEIKRQRAEQEAARRAVEERIRAAEAAQFAAEEARRAAEAARARAEEEARARRPAGGAPLASEHEREAQKLQQLGSGREAQVMRDKEAHLERLRAQPADPGRLAESLQSKSPRAQAEARDELNAIMAREGVRIAEADLRFSGGREIEVNPNALPSGANAAHNWSGKIIVEDQRLVANASKFFARAAAGESFEPGRLQELAKVESELYNKLVETRRSLKSAKGARREKLQAQVDRLQADHEKAKDAVAAHIAAHKQVVAANILIHETAHGHSPIRSHAYQGVGVPAEEISTELAARAIMERQFGVPSKLKDDFGRNTYRGYIQAAVDEVSRHTGLSAEESFEVLKRSSVALKQDHTQIIDRSYDLVRKFVDKMADDLKLTGQARADFTARMRESFDGKIVRAHP